MARRGENIYRRKDGRWEGRYGYHFDDNGKRHYKAVYAHSYSEVREKLSKLRTNKSPVHHHCKLTVKELFSEWFRAVKMKVKPSTYSCYHMKYIKHILPEFGDMGYGILNTNMLHEFIDNKVKMGLSKKYVKDIVVVFKSMSKYTSKIYSCSDPLNDVVMPSTEKAERKMLDESSQNKLSRLCMNNITKPKIAVLLSYYTGLRIGEICGLKWSDIDFISCTLHIRRTVQRIYDGKRTKVMIGSPKSKSSVRTIPIPEFLVKVLKQYRGTDSGYVISEKATATEPRALQYRFKTLLKKADVPSINFHSLRHMFATNCIRLGFDVKTLSEILGHSSVEVTLNRYVHSSMDRKKGFMDRIKPCE